MDANGNVQVIGVSDAYRCNYSETFAFEEKRRSMLSVLKEKEKEQRALRRKKLEGEILGKK